MDRRLAPSGFRLLRVAMIPCVLLLLFPGLPYTGTGWGSATGSTSSDRSWAPGPATSAPLHAGGTPATPRRTTGTWRAERGVVAAAAPSRSVATPADPGDPSPIPPPIPRDSADHRDRAEGAQRRFERVRVRHLPLRHDPGGSRCDDRVGRMCWWHETGGRWTPEPEDEEVREARENLLGVLEEVAREIPGDRWVLGQRVWYTGEAGRWAEALEAARACGPPARWWCDALAGLALHNLGRYPEAERVFERALEAMDGEQAADWANPAVLLDGKGRNLLDEADGGESRWIRRTWALADPFHLVPGNDRRSEHYARLTVAAIRTDAANPHGLSWGDDLEELLIRYGWEVGWDRYRPGPMDRSLGTQVAGHEHPSSRSWIPPGEALEDPVGVDRSLWRPGLEYAPSAYAPAYAPVVLPMDPVVSIFPRAGGGIVGVRWRMPEDTTYRTREGLEAPGALPPALEGSVPAGGVFLIDPDNGEVVARAVREGSPEGALVVEAPPGAFLLSVEAWDPQRRFGGRVREGLILPEVLPDLPTLSDLVLLEGEGEPRSVEEVLRRARPHHRVRSGSSIRVAWEVTGLGFRQETLSYRLGVARTDRDLLRRAGEWLGLVDEREPLELAWAEGAPSSLDPVLRSVILDLPELPPGEYRLRLELETHGRETVVREQVLHVFRPTRPEGPPEQTEPSAVPRPSAPAPPR